MARSLRLVAVLSCQVCWGNVAAVQDWIAWSGDVELGPPDAASGWRPLKHAESFASDEWEVEGMANGYRQHHPEATHYTLGGGSVVVEVWQPFPDTAADGVVAASFRGALFSLYRHRLDEVQVKLVNSDWDTVGSAVLCRADAPCPNVILLGDAQVPGRVAAGSLMAIDGHLGNFSHDFGWRLEDDTHRVAHFQYNMEGHWRALPLTLDLRLLGFNRTTLRELGEELPPPHGRRASWTWRDFTSLVCKVAAKHGKGTGLLSDSITINDDFQQLMFMAQSRGVQLLERRSCGLKRKEFHEVVELLGRMVREQCVAPEFWGNASAEINDKDDESLQDAAFGVPSTHDAILRGGVPGFFFSSGVDAAASFGKCDISLVRRTGPACDVLVSATGAAATESACARRAVKVGGNTFALGKDTCQVLRCKGSPRYVDSVVQVYSTFCSELAYADMPGGNTFLGGAGLAMPTYADCQTCWRDDVGRHADFSVPGRCSATDKDIESVRVREGWRILLEMVNRTRPWILQLNSLRAAMTPPAAPSLLGRPPYTEEVWQPAVRALRRGVPSQYPSGALAEAAKVPRAAPLREALLGAIRGTQDASLATDRVCDALEEIVRPCDRTLWTTDPRCRNPVDDKQGCRPGEALLSGAQTPAAGTCNLCAPGTYQGSRGVSESCSPCPSGTFSDVFGATGCESCGHGEVTLTAAASKCSQCPEGWAVMEGGTCEPCPAGYYGGGEHCEPCPVGTISEEGSHSAEHCELSGLLKRRCIGAAWLLLCAILTFLCYRTFANAIPLIDMRIESGCLVAFLNAPHYILGGAALPVLVRFRNTGHHLLEGRVFRIARRASKSVRLLEDSGEPVTERMDTSIGEMRVLFPQSLLVIGIGYIPVVVLLLLCSVLWAVLLAFGPGDSSSQEATLWSLLAIAVVASTWGCCWLQGYSRLRNAPMQRRRRRFLETLSSQNPNPEACERGPGRAVSMSQILELYGFFQDFIMDRKMYYIASNMIRPLTQPKKLSYAELAGPQRVEWFVSHFWGQDFKDFVSSLQKHAEHVALLESRAFSTITFWVCTLSNNQWDVGAELGNGDPLNSSFYLALRSPECRGTTMVMDQNAWPLTRSWCLFEVFQTCLLTMQRDREDFIGLLLCTPTGVLQHGGTGVDAAVAVAHRLSELSLESASATSLTDKVMIDTHVKHMPGGFRAMNSFVRGCIKQALYTVHKSFEDDFGQLLSALDRIPQRECQDEASGLVPPRLLGRTRILTMARKLAPAARALPPPALPAPAPSDEAEQPTQRLSERV